MKYKIKTAFLSLLLLIGPAAQGAPTKSANESVVDMMEILAQGNDKDFCLPERTTILEIVKELEVHTTKVYKNGIITTPQMKMAFKKLYPC